jgi:hypothetical protein
VKGETATYGARGQAVEDGPETTRGSRNRGGEDRNRAEHGDDGETLRHGASTRRGDQPPEQGDEGGHEGRQKQEDGVHFNFVFKKSLQKSQKEFLGSEVKFEDGEGRRRERPEKWPGRGYIPVQFRGITRAS